MARRPHNDHIRQSKPHISRQSRQKAVDFFSEPADDHDPEPHPDAHTDSDGDDGEDDLDVPRVSQWIDDDELELHDHTDSFDTPLSPGSDADTDAEDDHPMVPSSRRLQSLEDDLSTLPLGTLRSAQRALAHAHTLSDTESGSESQSDDDSDEAEGTSPRLAEGKAPEQQQSSKSKTELAKRTNKHAPVEITSKRPVSRRRTVVDDRLPKPRDPRFMHATGRYDSTKFRQQYNFLADLRKDELSTLREHTKRARKLITNSPSHLREEREEEIQRLERAMKRAESTVNLDNRERVELEAVRSAKQTEKGKRIQGKADWWMKRSAKKELLAKARIDAIASVGGKQAVKKALEKKQKKISQKEKKMRPVLRNVEAVESSNGKRRRPVGSLDTGGVKRRKIV